MSPTILHTSRTRSNQVKNRSITWSRDQVSCDQRTVYVMPESVCVFFCFENLEKSRVATAYIHATPTLRPTYFHFAVYVEMSYSRYRSSVNETGIIGTQGSKSLCEVSGLGCFVLCFFCFHCNLPRKASMIVVGHSVLGSVQHIANPTASFLSFVKIKTPPPPFLEFQKKGGITFFIAFTVFFFLFPIHTFFPELLLMFSLSPLF